MHAYQLIMCMYIYTATVVQRQIYLETFDSEISLCKLFPLLFYMGKGDCSVAVSLDGGLWVSHCTAAFLAGTNSHSKSMHCKSTADLVRRAVLACDPTCILFKTNNNKRFHTL